MSASHWHWRQGIIGIGFIIRQSIRPIIRLVPIPRVLILAASLFLIGCGVVFALSAGQQAMSPKSDSFASYDQIWPGQPVAALDDYRCGPFYVESVYISRNLPFMNCQIRLNSGSIQLITVVCSERVIQHLIFDVEGVEYADAIQQWGPPDLLEITKQFYNARWDEGIFVRGELSKAFSFHAPVQQVILS